MTTATLSPDEALPPVPFNAEALRPLFRPWEEPNRHRQRSARGGPAVVTPGRRPSRVELVRRVRHEVGMWRHNGYVGASDTSRQLLRFWFETAHEGDFRFHFCQQEAIETIIWLYEVAGYRSLSAMYESMFGDDEPPFPLKSITVGEDAWARYCTKAATGSGKSLIMALCVVWSYFHRSLEVGSDLAKHFVVIAPNVIVFERLKDDLADARVFSALPLIPPEWKEYFQLQTVLQDEAGGATTEGTLYLTNIHRLYERDKPTRGGKSEDVAWAGPSVKRATALKVGEALRERIASHPSLLVLNDEAHHLHDPDSAWNEAIDSLDRQSRARGNAGVCAQLDFTATPKYSNGTLFRHIISDFPLGEAVDAGIVKVPVIGRSDELKPRAGDSAAQRYGVHLSLGYKQYEAAFAEWQGTRKPILFVMTENTETANEIAAALDGDAFPLLKGRVVNLHTKLKGKIKKRQDGSSEFITDEKAMSDEDMKVIRQISRDLDKDNSPYRAVVSVLMLREGWDVKNVTTIVPLRAFDSATLAEQTLGRGLRRMTPPGEALERVTVVEHSAFVQLYANELAEEGVLVGVTDAAQPPKPMTVPIFVDTRKPVADLEVSVPTVSDALHSTATLEALDFEEVSAYFRKRYQPLPIHEARSGAITFEERALFTDELVASWDIDRGMLALGYTAVSVFVRDLERACRLQGAFGVLAPLVQRFIEEVLFERPVSLYDGSADHRMADNDVIEHVRATFTPLILAKTVTREERQRSVEERPVSAWRSFQATNSTSHPCAPADKTMFNLVPCDSDLEVNFAEYCDLSDNVAAFVRNAGPQKLMIDYIAPNGRPALYVPDFLVRMKDGSHFLVETKGAEDNAVAMKARAAVEWCKTASTKGAKWQYVYVPMAVFEAATDYSLDSLSRACAPRLKSLLDSLNTPQLELSFEMTPAEVKKERTDHALAAAGIPDLPDDIRIYVEQAVNQLAYDRSKSYPQFGGAFQPLLVPFERLCGELLVRLLGHHVPPYRDEQARYFDLYLEGESGAVRAVFQKNTRNLQKNLVHGANCNRIGTLLFCMDYPHQWQTDFGDVWEDVRAEFAAREVQGLLPSLSLMNDFRNRHVAHVDEPLTDGTAAEAAMGRWIAGLAELYHVVSA